MDNPYAVTSVPAAHAEADARAAFLQRTYMLLLAGVGVFAATLWAAGNVPAVNGLAVGLWNTNRWIVLIGILGGGFLVRAMAMKRPINVVLYFAYAFLFGLLLAPVVLWASANQPLVLTQASLVTALVFTGLTAWVFVSGKDFSFLGGALTVGALGLFGVVLCSMLFGFSLGAVYAGFGVLLFSGYILYDTSRILHHYPTNAHVPAAIELFVSLIMLFQHVLHLLMSLQDD